MSNRGTYRTIHSSLPDDPDFQRLSPQAQLVFYTIRLSKEHGASGIFRYYIEVIARRSNLSPAKVSACLSELSKSKPRQSLGWVAFDDVILWVVNGLRYDPHLSLANEKHKKTVEREISELPRRQLILTYCDYYKLSYPYDTHSLQEYESDSEGKDTEGKDTDTNTSPQGKGIPVEPVVWGARFCLIQKYNRESPENVPTVASPSRERTKREATYLRMFPEECWWTETFLQYHRSRFLSGKTIPGNGHGAFKPDFDWLLSRGKDGIENCVKVHDGRYRDG
jgi:hypothetical protein